MICIFKQAEASKQVGVGSRAAEVFNKEEALKGNLATEAKTLVTNAESQATGPMLARTGEGPEEKTVHLQDHVAQCSYTRRLTPMRHSLSFAHFLASPALCESI